MRNGKRLGLLSQESGVSPSGGLLTRTRLVGLIFRNKNPDGSWGHWSNYADEITPDIDESTPDVQEDPKNIGETDYYKKETHRTKLPSAPGQEVEARNPKFFMHKEFKDVRDLMPENQPRDFALEYFYHGDNHPMPQYELDPRMKHGGLGKPPKPLTYWDEENKLADELEQGLVKEKHKSLISPSDLERLAGGKKWNANARKIRANKRIEELLKNPEQF
jgi:hypothetical protein